MPFDVAEAINKLGDFVLRAPAIRAVMSNPIYTAMMIVFVMMLIILIMFRDADTTDPLLTTTLRTGFWMFLLLIGVMFLHNKVLSKELDDNTSSNIYDAVMGGRYEPGSVLEEATVGHNPLVIGAMNSATAVND